MQFQIITFGNGEILKGVLDAIAMCLNSQTGTLYEPLLRIGMIFGVLWAAIYSIWGDFLKAWGRATLPFIFIPPLLFIPSTPVYIHDVVSNYRDKVDNVPYGLAYVAHFVSQIGYEVTKQVDQVFSNVDDLKYHKSGFLMASNLIQQARSFQITNEDVCATMREFVCQCVAYEAMLGHKYTFEDLRHSSDIWGLVSAKPSAIRSFIWKHPHKPDEGTQPPEIVSCREGVKRFNRLWKGELDKAKTIFGIKLFGHTNPLNARTEFLKYLPASYGFLSNLSQSADQILKQQMMIHAVVDGIEQKSTSLGNAPNFAAQRAYLQQRSTYETLGAMASTSLMTMKAVLEGIVYAAFIFLVPLAMLPFGVKILLSWLQTLLWLQMWAPLYAVLNFMISMGARAKSIGMLSTSNPEGVTIASSAGLMNLNADISAMAGYLAMSVPFIAIALVKGVGSFVHMASHLGNVSQGAAAQSATDAVSGNYSFGNVSEGNYQVANSNMLFQSRAASYRSGAYQLIEGREDITTMADGSQIANIGVSNLPVSVNAAETQSTQASEMASQNYQKGFNLSQSSSQHLGDSYRNLVALSNNLAESESMNKGVTQGMSAEQSRNIHKGAQLIKSFADENHINTSKAADLFVEASMGGGIFMKGAAGGKTSTSASDQELLQKAQRYMEEENFQEAARESSQAAKSILHNLSHEASRRLAADVSGSYEKGMNERSEAMKNFNKAESYAQQAMNIRSNAASINANHTQQFVEWLAEQPRDNTMGKIGRRDAVNMVANDPVEANEWGRKFMREKGLMPSMTLDANPSQLKADYQAETGHQAYKVTKDAANEVRSQGESILTKANDLSGQGKQPRESVSPVGITNTQQGVFQEHGTSNQKQDIEQRAHVEHGRSDKDGKNQGEPAFTNLTNSLKQGENLRTSVSEEVQSVQDDAQAYSLSHEQTSVKEKMDVMREHHANDWKDWEESAFKNANNPFGQEEKSRESISQSIDMNQQQDASPQHDLFQKEESIEEKTPIEEGNLVNNSKDQEKSVFTDANNLSKQGKRLDESTSGVMAINSQTISEEYAGLSQEGTAIEKKVKSEQGRYVAKRVAEKVVQEGKGIINDVINIWNGGPQQK